MRTPEIHDVEPRTRMPFGAGAPPIDTEIAGEIGDTDIWDELLEVLGVYAGAV